MKKKIAVSLAQYSFAAGPHNSHVNPISAENHWLVSPTIWEPGSGQAVLLIKKRKKTVCAGSAGK